MHAQRYILEPYKPGGSNRFTCPGCGRRKCFTAYIDTQTGNYIDQGECGKCDHQASCAYHLPPREYFRLHPDASTRTASNAHHFSFTPPPPLPVCYIPASYVNDSHHPTSQFVHWLNTITTPEQARRAFDLYHLGATRSGGVIFWQIDSNGNTRTGKAMHYWPDGHRIKDAEDYARFRGVPFDADKSPLPSYFVHNRMFRRGQLPADHRIDQCLFGEHLLPTRPDLPVCLVESEKTAIICSIFYPDFLWLATGGCGLLQPHKLAPLRSRHLTIYPDSGELQQWSSIMQRTEGFNYRIVKALESYPKNTDIADLLLSIPKE